MGIKIIEKQKSSGFMILSVIFVMFIAFLGISILGHTITHIRILSSRLQKIDETQGIIRETVHYLHRFREKIFSEFPLNLFSPDEQYFNSEFFPDVRIEQTVLKNNFHFQDEKNPLFKKSRVTNTLNTCLTSNNRTLKSSIKIDILSGKIPLFLIPFFLQKTIETTEEKYLRDNHIDIITAQNPVIETIPTDFNISNFLIDSLKINGDNLSWSSLREKFGLEISEKPIEEGIYFVCENDAVESIFIQGDVQRLIFSVEDDIQKLEFHFRELVYECNYIPGDGYFLCWDPRIGNHCLFKEKIIVNGNVWGLEQKSGYSAFSENAGLVLLVSGQTVIRTSLETRNLELKKLRLNNLTLVCGHHELFDLPESQPEVKVDTEETINVEASILAKGTFENNSPDLTLQGSLFAKDIKNEGHIQINFIRTSTDTSQYFHTLDFTFISDFFIDFIEEVPGA